MWLDRKRLVDGAAATTVPKPPDFEFIGTKETCTYVTHRDHHLGRGTYGEAWRACRNGTDYVVKVQDFSELQQTRPEGCEIMTRKSLTEAQCLANCDHFAITRFVDQQVDPSGVVFFVMEYCNRGDLGGQVAQRLKNNACFTEDEILTIFTSVALALHHIHSKRMLHRDVKAENVFACSSGAVKLGDFGFSKTFGHTVSGGNAVATTQVGTPPYAAPEVFKGEPYGAKADIWSLGVLLYLLMCRHLPFSDMGMEALKKKVLVGKFTPPTGYGYSNGLVQLLQQLLVVDPAKRYSSAHIIQHLVNASQMQRFYSMIPQIFPPEEAAIHFQTIQRQCESANARLCQPNPTFGLASVYEGNVEKIRYEHGQWQPVPRYLALLNGNLHIAMNQTEWDKQRTMGPVNPQAPSVIPLTRVTQVFGLPQNLAWSQNFYSNVFCIEIEGAHCYFAVEQPTQLVQWLETLNQVNNV